MVGLQYPSPNPFLMNFFCVLNFIVFFIIFSSGFPNRFGKYIQKVSPGSSMGKQKIKYLFLGLDNVLITECPKLDRPLITDSVETADLCMG
jgi:hypothetical protein